MKPPRRLLAAVPPLTGTNARLAVACGPRFAARSIGLQRLSRRSFAGWHTQQRQRWWEYPWTVDKLKAHTPERGRVADFGAGTSPVPIALGQAGYSLVVVDPGAETLLGRKVGNEWDFFDYSNWSIESRRAGVEDAVFADGELAAAVSVSVLEHVPADVRRRGLERVAAAVGAGGTFVCTLDLLRDKKNLWNRVEDEVEPVAVHGTLVDAVHEARERGLDLIEQAWCPLRPEEPAVGLVFRRR